MGRQAAAEVQDAKVPFVIVDPRPETQQYARQHGYLLIQGDASDDQVLEQAGIRQAKGLIVTSGDDATNLYIVLSARVLKPDLFIVSRAVDEASVPKLLRAGANRAISPYAIGGRRLAHLILSPAVVDFFDTVIRKGDESINLECITVHHDSPVAGQTIAEFGAREKTGATVLVVLRDNRVLPNPPRTWSCGPAISCSPWGPRTSWSAWKNSWPKRPGAGELVIAHRRAAEQMLLDDTLEHLGRAGVIPDAFRVDHRDRAVPAHPQAIRLGAGDAVLGGPQ